MVNHDEVSDLHDGILDWVQTQSANEFSTDKGNAFCQWSLENIFNLSSDDAIDAQFMSGSYDYGIDALFDVEEEQKLVVIQSKYESSHDLQEVRKFHYNMREILKKPEKFDANLNAQRAIAVIQDAIQKRWKVCFYYITSALFTDKEKDSLSRLEGIDEDFFVLDVFKITDLIIEKQKNIPDIVNGKWFTLRLSSREILKAEQTAVIAVSLGDIHDFVSRGSDSLFASNVRNYLRSTKINSEIRKTIQDNPEQFWLYNNGITMVCDDFQEEGFFIKILTPQIVNGCQTAKLIWDVLSRKNEAERQKLQGNVLVRIIKGTNDEEKQNITRYTNTQNAVRGKDFFSLEEFQRKLQQRFRKLGYYYEIQRGAFTALKPSEKAKYEGINVFDYLVPDRYKNVITALEAAQGYTSAFRQQPAVAYGNPNDLTPGGSWYDKIFDEYIKPDPILFLFPYLVREWTKKNGYSRGGGGWRAHSAHFFVYSYFLLALEIFKLLNLIDSSEEINPEKVPTEAWKTLFQAKEINEQLLFMTDGLLERYFEDSKVDEAVGQDVRKFLKSQETLNKHKPIFTKLVERNLASPRTKPLLEQIYALYNS